MKRKNASLLGNVLMGLGLVVMVVGVGYSILNQLPRKQPATILCMALSLTSSASAVLYLAGRSPCWQPRAGQRPLLVGAPLYDKRCRRNRHRHS